MVSSTLCKLIFSLTYDICGKARKLAWGFDFFAQKSSRFIKLLLIKHKNSIGLGDENASFRPLWLRYRTLLIFATPLQTHHYFSLKRSKLTLNIILPPLR